MEELLLAQVRGLLILSNAHQAAGNTKVCLAYLNRAKGLLKMVENIRQWESLEQNVAA